MKITKKKTLLMAAMAGIALGAGTPAARAEEKAGEVKCYGINQCGAHAKCSVGADDLAAVRNLLGTKAFKMRFGKSEAHGCGAQAKCGSSAKKLNWAPVNGEVCSEKGGIVIEEKDGGKVAKKA